MSNTFNFNGPNGIFSRLQSIWGGDASSPLLPTELPGPAPVPFETDALLAKEMNSLSVDERSRVLEEVHGVADILEETAELVSALLLELQERIDEIPENNKAKAAYNLAYAQSPEYVMSAQFRLNFLRADDYDAKGAAVRLLRFFDEKLSYFGTSLLTKRITLDCLDEADRASVRSGMFQVSNFRDRVGRRIIYTVPSIRVTDDTAPLMKSLFYVYMTAVESDEEPSCELSSNLRRRHDFVHILYHMGKFEGVPHNVWCMAKLRISLPLKINVDHICYNDGMLRPFVSVGMVALDPRGKARMRFHFGSDMEAHYKLLTFGIPSHVLPISAQGEVRQKEFHEWYRRREEIENGRISPLHATVSQVDISLSPFACESLDSDQADKTMFSSYSRPSRRDSGTSSIGLESVDRSHISMAEVTDISDNDILFGRGRPIQNRPANCRFRQLLEDHRDAYDRADRQNKAGIAIAIVRNIKAITKGRFLKQDASTGNWYEVDDDAARVKVGHALRTLRRAVKRQAKENSENVPSFSASEGWTG